MKPVGFQRAEQLSLCYSWSRAGCPCALWTWRRGVCGTFPERFYSVCNWYVFHGRHFETNHSVTLGFCLQWLLVHCHHLLIWCFVVTYWTIGALSGCPPQLSLSFYEPFLTSLQRFPGCCWWGRYWISCPLCLFTDTQTFTGLWTSVWHLQPAHFSFLSLGVWPLTLRETDSKSLGHSCPPSPNLC